MKSAFLMIILTMMDNGQMSSAFVNAKSETACVQKANMIGAILRKGEMDVREIKCFPSALRFDKFEHKTAANAARTFYAVRISDKTATVTPLENLNDCTKEQKAQKIDTKEQLYCTSSTQKKKAPKTRTQ